LGCIGLPQQMMLQSLHPQDLVTVTSTPQSGQWSTSPVFTGFMGYSFHIADNPNPVRSQDKPSVRFAALESLCLGEILSALFALDFGTIRV